MKAIVCERYGPPEVLRPADIPKPVPKDDEVLIRVRAATVTKGDCELRAFKPPKWIWVPARLGFGVTKPRQPVLGMEVAGEIEAIGKDVTRFQPGDRVFGTTGFGMGAYAEYKCMKATGGITTVPQQVGFAEAACIPTGGLNGLHFVRRAAVKSGERVLVVGAGGSIGMFAVQMAKLEGAEVTAIDRGDKLDMLRAIGVDRVIDYSREDFTDGRDRYDVVIDVAGKTPFSRTLAVLRPDGRYVLGNPQFLQMVRALWVSKRTDKSVLFALAGESIADLDYLKRLVAEGGIKVVIDRIMPLADAVAAHRYVDADNKTGALVLDVALEN